MIDSSLWNHNLVTHRIGEHFLNRSLKPPFHYVLAKPLELQCHIKHNAIERGAILTEKVRNDECSASILRINFHSKPHSQFFCSISFSNPSCGQSSNWCRLFLSLWLSRARWRRGDNFSSKSTPLSLGTAPRQSCLKDKKQLRISRDSCHRSLPPASSVLEPSGKWGADENNTKPGGKWRNSFS